MTGIPMAGSGVGSTGLATAGVSTPSLASGDTPVSEAAAMEAPNDFALALRASIAARGLSLDRLRTRLVARRVNISVATLSYWQSGRSRPERASSIAALATLEDILELPPGFLASKVHPRPAQLDERVAHYQDASLISGLGHEGDIVSAAMAHLGLTFDDGLQRLSYHDQITVKANRTDGSHTVRMVLRATRDGADRYPVYLGHDDPAAFPFVTAMTNVRLGRIVELRADAAVMVEMLLDRPLREGESMLVEHRLEAVGQSLPYDHFQRLVVAPIREMVIEVRFHPEAIPAAGNRTATVDGIHTITPLPAPAPVLQTLALDVPAGLYGMSWSW